MKPMKLKPYLATLMVAPFAGALLGVAMSSACSGNRALEAVHESEPCWNAVEREAQARLEAECPDTIGSPELLKCMALPSILLELQCRQAQCSGGDLASECQEVIQ